MSLLIGCPIYGQPFMPFMESMERLQYTLQEVGLKHDVLYIKGESLVQRARNNLVTSFLETDYDRLLQIDSDLEFTPEDVSKLWNLDVDVCCASYPMKRIGIHTTAWKNGKLVDLDSLSGPTPIDFAATGFLMVKREVFLRMKEFYPERVHMEGLSEGNFEDRRESFAWFDPRVTKAEKSEDRIYLSEDYSFSHDWREMGGEIILEPAIRLKHYGIYGYG